MKISGGEIEKQYFSISEANLMIPFLERAFVRIIQLQNYIRDVYARLERLGFAPDSEEFEVTDVDAPSGVIHHRAMLKGLIGAIRKQLQAIHNKGALVKGLDRGLVDWYAQKNGDDIFLCWELGEDEVKYWHPIEGGYPTRRPINELDEKT